jgi:hypothetical protein
MTKLQPASRNEGDRSVTRVADINPSASGGQKHPGIGENHSVGAPRVTPIGSRPAYGVCARELYVAAKPLAPMSELPAKGNTDAEKLLSERL